MDAARFDADYIRRLKEGDPATEAHFCAHFSELLMLKFRKRIRPWSALVDAQQETFVRVLQALRSNGVQCPERLGAFVNAVARNVLLEFGRLRFRYSSGDELPPEPADDRVQADEGLIDEERKRHVHQVLSELPRKDQTLLRMVFFEEKDKTEVCRFLHVTPQYLRVVLHRAKARFRDRFVEKEPIQ